MNVHTPYPSLMLLFMRSLDPGQAPQHFPSQCHQNIPVHISTILHKNHLIHRCQTKTSCSKQRLFLIWYLKILFLLIYNSNVFYEVCIMIIQHVYYVTANSNKCFYLLQILIICMTENLYSPSLCEMYSRLF